MVATADFLVLLEPPNPFFFQGLRPRLALPSEGVIPLAGVWCCVVRCLCCCVVCSALLTLCCASLVLTYAAQGLLN